MSNPRCIDAVISAAKDLVHGSVAKDRIIIQTMTVEDKKSVMVELARSSRGGELAGLRVWMGCEGSTRPLVWDCSHDGIGVFTLWDAMHIEHDQRRGHEGEVGSTLSSGTSCASRI
ncbi:uncharacterized protein RCC_05577 [Ramularia collo-cygni]|uniref:Uncharacterized protein n=1 Tax=Ramularia collo-cygni TaxID=112498 RepID=A0A2D3VGB9_9PEZI|nr:uncharacterized protein RCC_05577 [Ramularia collo-cygni]CZT19723.1 uncharacterized protein RCC_05577 [Ramularia collo-cygni]